MKNVLITGVARGLGKSLSEFLIGKGFCVLGTARHLDKVLPSNGLKIYQLDLTNRDSIDQVVNALEKSGEPIDAIIHNAGVAYLDPADVLDEDECRSLFEVNFFGPLRLTKKLLPLLKKQKRTNLIFMSSIVSIDHWPYLGVYAASKAALETVAFEWAVLLKKWNIHVSVIQPNPLPTDMQIMRSKNAPNSPYPELKNRKLEWESVENVCGLVLKILNADTPQFQYQTGPFSEATARQFLQDDIYQKMVEKYQSTYSS
jgi:NAD(P)-dependent dehydrogenase (short-subunit alcohol dehydrogenase family)